MDWSRLTIRDLPVEKWLGFRQAEQPEYDAVTELEDQCKPKVEEVIEEANDKLEKSRVAITQCVGRVMEHSSVEIDENGVMVCGGTTLMSGYDNGDGDLIDGKVVTRDLGSFDENGMLHLLGRNDDIINLGGFKVAPTEVENASLAMDGIRDCICIAVNHPISVKALKLLFVPSEGITVGNTDIAEFLKSRLETLKVPSLYECVSEIKRTFNGKPDRKAYKQSQKRKYIKNQGKRQWRQTLRQIIASSNSVLNLH